jgi:RNA polymerase sigma-70 factor (ECF subfamily)
MARQRKGPDDPRPRRIPPPGAGELVARARGGDVDAFAELYRLSLPIVYANLFGRCGDAALAEDLTSDTFLRAMRSIGRFEGAWPDFLAWIMRIGRNLFLDHVKSGRVRWEVVVDEAPVTLATGDTEHEALMRVEGTRLRAALARLTPDQQEVVHLRFLDDLSIAETAGILGRAEGAVKALQFRALRALQRMLEES